MFYEQDLDSDNVADLAVNVAATLSPLLHSEVPLIGIVSDDDGGIIAYAIGIEHAERIVQALAATS